MKKTICVILILIFALLLAGCESNVNDNFEIVYKDSMYEVFQHKDTGVLYLWLNPHSSIGGITVMLDKDGKPLTEWRNNNG